MWQWLSRHPRSALVAGFAMGLCLGLGMLAGSWITLAWGPKAPFVFPEIPLHATATDAGETMSMATGLVADGMEGVFFLDFLTGDLQCCVLSGRTGQMAGYFTYNVIQDLGIEPGRKNPRYLMVTGLAPIRAPAGAGSLRPADSLVYVADAQSGNFGVYAIPWNRQATATNQPQQGPMIRCFVGTARSLELRGQ
jgi:hypothetical protein